MLAKLYSKLSTSQDAEQKNVETVKEQLDFVENIKTETDFYSAWGKMLQQGYAPFVQLEPALSEGKVVACLNFVDLTSIGRSRYTKLYQSYFTYLGNDEEVAIQKGLP